MQGFIVSLSGDAPANTLTFTITHNDVATAISCSIGVLTGACQDNTDSITVSAGDTLGVQITASTGTSSQTTYRILVHQCSIHRCDWVRPAPLAFRVRLAPLARRVRLAWPA